MWLYVASKTTSVCTFCPIREVPRSVSGTRVRVAEVTGPPSNTLCEARVDNGYAFSAGVWTPGATPPFRCNVCIPLDAAKHRTTLIGVYKARCDPMSARKDIFAGCSWMAELSHAAPGELPSALRWTKKHFDPTNTSGLEDALGQGSGGPSDGEPLLLMTAQFSGAGTPAGRGAMESVDRIRVGRTPHMSTNFCCPMAPT